MRQAEHNEQAALFAWAEWAAALIWTEGDDLITQAEAAQLTGLSASTISSRIDRGQLRAYIDPTAASRQGRRLVRRRDVVGE